PPPKTKKLLRKIRKASEKPMIFTFRRMEEGGRTRTTLKYYKELLAMVAEFRLADIVDVEASAIEHDNRFISQLQAYGVYVIISRHDFTNTPDTEDIIKEIFSLERSGADMVKVAYMPQTKKDVIHLMRGCVEATGSYSSCPVIAISMGSLGMVSRLIGEFMESAITFASITKSSAPGQVNVESINEVLDVIHDNYRKVFLTGFMGAGKTAVGNMLEDKYGLKKIDLDGYIEMKEKMSIADIFSSQSEEVFRQKETKHLKKILQKNYQVISLGGGAVLRQENIDLMKEKGILVLLTATPETIASRIKKDGTRPLLGDNFDLEYITKLMKQRENTYRTVADVIISTDGKSLDDICKEIIETLGLTM
ncbi:MAG: type I 3-dehydroquinate dehydratase, partial [Parasporobacterium sp.]|nr:type I 3-dehydroquinate dehydratase [Parasporobacterium sp.]